MAQSTLVGQQAISGKEGHTIMTTADGRNVDLFVAKDIELIGSLHSVDVPQVGVRVDQTKITGASLKGSLTVFYGTPEFAAMVQAYFTTGVFPLFTLKFVNNDPASVATTVGGAQGFSYGGPQMITALNCVLTGDIPLALMNTSNEPLNIKVNYAASGMQVDTPFGASSLWSTVLANLKTDVGALVQDVASPYVTAALGAL